jgi:hypothetical protein
MIIAVDFDGTIVTDKYPDIGDPVPLAIESLLVLQKDNKLILWTLRSGELVADAVSYLASNGVKLWGINENHDQYRFSDSHKQHADFYIDDKNVGCPISYSDDGGKPYVNWDVIGRLMGIKLTD